MSTPFGKETTPTAARAGYGSLKYCAMTSLTVAKLSRSVKKDGQLDGLVEVATPAASAMARRLLKDAMRSRSAKSPSTSFHRFRVEWDLPGYEQQLACLNSLGIGADRSRRAVCLNGVLAHFYLRSVGCCYAPSRPTRITFGILRTLRMILRKVSSDLLPATGTP